MAKAAEAVTPPPPAVVEEQPSPVEAVPKPRTLISLEQLEQVNAAGSVAERVERLQHALGVQHYPVNPRTSVWVDFCFGVLNFARDDAHLPPDKTLGLLTLAHEVYEFATHPLAGTVVGKVAKPAPSSLSESNERAETKVDLLVPASPAPADAYPTVEAVYDQFREKIRHASGVVTDGGSSQDQPDPKAPSLPSPFSPTQVARIVSFFTSTFFRHLRAYQYLSRVPRPSVVRELPLPTETPLPPAALIDAAPQAE
ncbi:unnamed protein product [Phytophthora lilii]|uniref:Unnamed protein product n=1 Tax=Phytophthora lilii TaxID=2077276 RepID=A0A9W6X720_9STRA|nr:unnamed protein product [Phytophthora lilii]